MKIERPITLVLGASLKSYRYSHQAILRLRLAGVPAYAFGLKVGRVGDVLIHTDIQDFVDSSIHTFSLYLGPDRQSDLLQWVKMLKPQRIIFNPGTENPSLYPVLVQEGVQCEEACTLVLLASNQYGV